jgi:hypothetical protein
MASLALGTMHMDLGDFSKAERYFRLAEAAGHPSAAHALRELAAARRAAPGTTLPTSCDPGDHARRAHPQSTTTPMALTSAGTRLAL